MPTFVVREGNIATYDGDAIVNAANNHLILGGGVAGAIREAGGPSIQAACSEQAPIEVGEAAITTAGALAVQWVIHAAAMGDQPATADSIRESTIASIRLAAQHGVKRIAFPVLGSGIAGFPFEKSATIMHDAVRGSPYAETFDEIVFYGYRSDQTSTLRRLFRI